jgi:YbbR domain-containing protein
MAYRDYILHNFWWKLLSLLLAALMWLTIETAFQKDKFLGETPVVTSSRRVFPSVPVTLLTSPSNTNDYTVDPLTVTVELSGAADQLSKVTERQLHVFVDLSDAGDERRFRRYIMTQAPGNLKVERPNQIMAMVERKAK